MKVTVQSVETTNKRFNYYNNPTERKNKHADVKKKIDRKWIEKRRRNEDHSPKRSS